LNAWLAGYESVLKKMTIGNFDWFMHTMLFLHTERVINRQQAQVESAMDDDDDDDDDASLQKVGNGFPTV
jgi:hypothetical protein